MRGSLGWRWWLAPLAMLLAVSLWFVPMLLTVAASGSEEYAAYRDEILFKQTVGRYAAAWHHVKGWYYFIVEVSPATVAALEPAAVLAGAALQDGVPRTQRACLAAAVLGAHRARVLLGEPGQARRLHPAGVARTGVRGDAVPRIGAVTRGCAACRIHSRGHFLRGGRGVCRVVPRKREVRRESDRRCRSRWRHRAVCLSSALRHGARIRRVARAAGGMAGGPGFARHRVLLLHRALQ